MYASPYIRFDGEREKQEWFEGCLANMPKARRIHPALYVMVLAAALWYYRRTGEPVVITHILRTREEQRKFYPDQPNKRSTHEFGQAADLRTRNLSFEVAQEWAEWLNLCFDYYGRLGSMTALVHEVGKHGMHFHLQVGPHEKLPPVPETFIKT